MTPEQVKYAREKFGTGDLVLFCAEAEWINGRNDGVHIIWDDENELAHIVSTNTEYRVYPTTPFIVKSIMYDTINSLSLNATPEYLYSWLSQLEKDNKLTSEQKEKIFKEMDKYTPASNMYIKPQTMSAQYNEVIKADKK